MNLMLFQIWATVIGIANSFRGPLLLVVRPNVHGIRTSESQLHDENNPARIHNLLAVQLYRLVGLAENRHGTQ